MQNNMGRVFAQHGHSASYYVVYPGNNPENQPPTEACMIHSKPHRGCRIQDPGTCGDRWWKTADFLHSVRTAHSAPPWCTILKTKGLWRPVVENSQLFAQRAHSA